MKRKMNDNNIAGKARMLIKHKLREKRGFSLAETLLAVLILLLVSVVVATGMPAATNAYNKVILGANAKMMLSTAITALHDEIGTAWKVGKVEGDTTNTKLAYFNASTGAKSELSLDNGKAIQIKDYLSLSGDLIHDASYTEGEAYHLVADEKAGMYVTYTQIGYSDGIVTIEGLKVKKDDGTTVLAQFADENGTAKDFTIRVLSKDAV